MDVIFDPVYEKFIDAQVKAGRFSSSAEVVEAGIARLMLDPGPDVLDDQDVVDIQHSLDQIRQGEVLDATTLHDQIRKRFANK